MSRELSEWVEHGWPRLVAQHRHSLFNSTSLLIIRLACCSLDSHCTLQICALIFYWNKNDVCLWSHWCMSVFSGGTRASPWRLLEYLNKTCGETSCAHTMLHASCWLCLATPTESPGDEQRGVWEFTQLETGELEESQRTFLENWNCELTWGELKKLQRRCVVSSFVYVWTRQRLRGRPSWESPLRDGRDESQRRRRDDQ